MPNRLKRMGEIKERTKQLPMISESTTHLCPDDALMSVYCCSYCHHNCTVAEPWAPTLSQHQLSGCAPAWFLYLHPTRDPAESIANQQCSLSWRVTQGPRGGGRGEDFNGRDPLMITSSGEPFISLLNCQKTWQ